MKTTTFAAAAAILGTVSADGWESWSASADATSADPTWTEWSASSKTPDAKTDDPSTWTEWTSTKPVVATSTDPSTWSDWDTTTTTSSKPVDPTSTETWGAWDPNYTTPSEKTSTTKDTQTWSDWSSTTSSKPSEKTSTDPAWANWEDPSKKTSTSTAVTWSDWSSTTSSKPAVKTSTDPAWGEWDDGKKTTSKPSVPTSTAEGEWSTWKEPVETIKSTRTQWITVTVYNNEGETWSAWSAPATQTDSKTVYVSSTITKTATDGAWSAWASPSLTVADGCKLQVSLSYGLPIWNPTPSVNWEEWKSATSSKPSVPSSTASTYWGEWSSATSSKPSEKTTTSSAVWGNWDGKSTTSSKPVIATTATSWAAWGAEDKAADVANWNPWTATATAANAQKTWGSWTQDKNGISANGNKFGMTYSPYTADSKCKDASVVAKDIAAMAAKGFTSVRVYSTDCQTLENVGKAARDNKMKVILGVFISETGISGAQPQVDAIAKWAQWDIVELIVVGNEAVFSNRCSASDLAGFIASSKQTFKNAGFKGAITTTDELSVWQSQGSAWCSVVDVVTANLYAFFNPNTAAQDAGTFIQSQIAELSKICPGKEVYVMESGWPSAGECNGKACPSPENQAIAIKGIQAAVGAKVVFFSYEDEQWKTPGQFNVEQHWGCGAQFK